MDTKEIYLYGASGHAKVVIDILESMGRHAIKGIYDDYSNKEKLLGVPVLRDKSSIKAKDTLVISIGNNLHRKDVVDMLSCQYDTLVHKEAYVSNLVFSIDEGTVVMAKGIVNPNVKIGKHCIINTGSIVEHDCVLENFVHISPNATILGGAFIGSGTQIGAGATVLPNVKIGKWATIGAGSVIHRDVPDYAVVVGVPGKIIKTNHERKV